MARTAIDHARFAADYTAGASIPELVARYGCSRQALYALRQSLGLPAHAYKRGSRNGPRHRAIARPELDPETARTRSAKACAALLERLRAHHPLPVRAASPCFSIKAGA